MSFSYTSSAVIIAAFNGAVAGILSNNRMGSVPEPIVTEEQLEALTPQTVGPMGAALAFAVAVDMAFVEIGGYDAIPFNAASVASLSKGLWVNRFASVALNSIPADEEGLESWIENIDASYGSAYDPETYLPFARALTVAVYYGPDFLENATDPPIDVTGGGVGAIGNVRTQSLHNGANLTTEVTSAGRVPVNEAPSNPAGSMPDVVLEVTPGNKVLVQFVAAVSTDGVALTPIFGINAEDGAGNGFNPVPGDFIVIPAINGRALGVIQTEYIAANPQQTIRPMWASGSGVNRVVGNAGAYGSFNVRVEEVTP